MTAPFRFDATSGLLTWGDCAAKLTRQHSKIVSLLASAYPRAVATEALITAVWGGLEIGDSDLTLRVHVHNARARMAAAGMPAAIQTVWGLGFIWRGEIELLGDAPLLVRPADTASLKRLLDTHPNAVLADHVRWAVFGV